MVDLMDKLLLQTWSMEREFELEPWRVWMEHEGVILYAVSTVMYLLLIFGIQRWMRDRPRFVLRLPLCLWNLGLAVFSIVCAWRLNVATHRIISQPGRGFHSLICERHCFGISGQPAAIWLLLFAFSKLIEYGDTVFVVLRKAKLIVLHWYHHLITYLIVTYLFAHAQPTIFVMAMINTYIHSIMYPYYALRILGVAVPKRVAMCITSLQITQLLMGFLINVYAAWAMITGRSCDVDRIGVGLGLFGFGTVLALFVNFFVHAYILQTPKKKPL